VASLSASDVWAVGRADNTSTPYSQYAPLILHWNGTTWSVVPGATTGTGELWGVAGVAPDDVWAVGSQALIEHWNGRTWTVAKAPSPACDALHAVTAIASNDVWAVGVHGTPGGVEQTCIEQWNGSSWSVVPSPNPGSGSPPGGRLRGRRWTQAPARCGRWALATPNRRSPSSTRKRRRYADEPGGGAGHTAPRPAIP
jgi:hypothetical protein